MENADKSKESWWQTVPGVLTALTGIITAVAGLFVVLHQVGLLGAKDKPAVAAAPVSNVGSPPARPSVPATGGAAGYSIVFPNGTEAVLPNYGDEVVYNILETKVDRRNTGRLRLNFSVRLTNKGYYAKGLANDTFRLLVDGVPRAPINSLSENVVSRSAKEGDVLFDIPDTVRSLVLVVGEGKETVDLPIVLKKPDGG